MLKLNTSFSKKVPAEGEYTSQSYHASVEIELPDGLTEDQLRQRIHQTFDLVRTSVEAELHPISQDQPAVPPENTVPTTVQPRPPAPRPPPPPRTSRGQRSPKASSKQTQFLIDLGARNGLDFQRLNQEAHQRYGVPSINDLSREQASEFIDALRSTASGRAA